LIGIREGLPGVPSNVPIESRFQALPPGRGSPIGCSEAAHYSVLCRTRASYATSTARAIRRCPDWLGLLSQLNWFGVEVFSSLALQVLPPANGFEAAVERLVEKLGRRGRHRARVIQ